MATKRKQPHDVELEPPAVRSERYARRAAAYAVEGVARLDSNWRLGQDMLRKASVFIEAAIRTANMESTNGRN